MTAMTTRLAIGTTTPMTSHSKIPTAPATETGTIAEEPAMTTTAKDLDTRA